MSVLDELKQRAKQKASAAKPTVRRLDPKQVLPVKLAIYGHTGTGKTYFLRGPLEHGEKVFVISTDFGSNGLLTLQNYYTFKDPSKAYVLENLAFVEFSSYEEVEKFLESPAPYFEDFLPTVVVWEGFSTFNVDMLDEYILKIPSSIEKVGEMRHLGLQSTQQDWYAVKRGTVRALRKFLALANPDGSVPDKILTSLESTPEVDPLTRKVERSFLVHGSGRALIGPAFDVILETYKEEADDGTIKYFYRAEGASDKYTLKSRGWPLQPVEPADPVRLWGILKHKQTNKGE